MIEVGHIQMSDDTAELFGALAKAQALYQSVSKDRTADIQSKKGEASSYTYNYATLDAIWDEVRPHLTKHGICTIQSPYTDGKNVTVTTLLGHTSGQWVSGSVTLQATETHAQAAGSALSYCRRYSLQGMVCVTPESDDDASSAVGLGASASIKPAVQTVCPSCGKSGTIMPSKEEYGGGWFCFKKKGGCGAKFDTDPALATQAADDVPPTESSDIGEWGTKLKELIRSQFAGTPTQKMANEWLTVATGRDSDASITCKDEEASQGIFELLDENLNKEPEVAI